MKAKLTRLFLSLLVASTISFGFIQNVYAGPYGSSTYGTCTYQDQVCPAGSTSGSTTGAPDTGQEAVSLLWPAIGGFVGFLLVSFVAIRYINRDRAQKQ